MCGIGTTLVEAVHAGRDAVGVEYESRWADIADANVTHAHAQGAPGRAVGGAGRRDRLTSLLPAVLHGRVGAGGDLTAVRADRARPGPPHARAGVAKSDNRYGDDKGNLAYQDLSGLLSRVHRHPRRLRPAAAAGRHRGGHGPAVA